MRKEISLIAALASIFAAAASGAEEPSPPEQTPFVLAITGTRHRADVEAISKNAARIRGVSGLIETSASQNRVEFSGVYSGDVQSLLADIEGLAQDRFEVHSKPDKGGRLVITLRKLKD